MKLRHREQQRHCHIVTMILMIVLSASPSRPLCHATGTLPKRGADLMGSGISPLCLAAVRLSGEAVASSAATERSHRTWGSVRDRCILCFRGIGDRAVAWRGSASISPRRLLVRVGGVFWDESRSEKWRQEKERSTAYLCFRSTNIIVMTKYRWSVMRQAFKSGSYQMLAKKIQARVIGSGGQPFPVSKSSVFSTRGGSKALPANTLVPEVEANVSQSSKVTLPPYSDSRIQSEMCAIETPLFPIILPRSWEQPSLTTGSSETSTSTSILKTKSFIEISIATATDIIVHENTLTKPSYQMLKIATQPLIPKSSLKDFQGNEFYYPESMELLAETGMSMVRWNCPYVQWVGDKRTDNFMEEHWLGSYAHAGEENVYNVIVKKENNPDVQDTRKDINLQSKFTQALSSSQEVLVWSGKFVSTFLREEGNGAEIPIIKTMSVINKSPKYLAELMMDSSRVQVYNKMSLGRTDEIVFQTGVDTVNGSFGDGESKVVRNLTKPPLVNSLLEFVTCMHARKLRPHDSKLIYPNSNESVEGYIVVSRAVKGGNWSTQNFNKQSGSGGGEKCVRNDILLGVNLLKAVPGEPNKTELTAITHVYSPMVPLILAKNAGVKGAVDFVKDIRALP